MNGMSVYRQLVSTPDSCMKAMKREIGLRTSCAPFVIKLMSAMQELQIKTEQDGLNAANVLMAGLQTLMQGGIIAEDYDKVDFVKRGNTIVPSARVEAFYRAAARKGYRITDMIVPVPQKDKDTTYFKENFYNGEIIYTLEDRRCNPDREITADRLRNGYFAKFLCRLDVHAVQGGQRIVMSVCEMPSDEVLKAAAASEQGLYKSKWEEYVNQNGKKRKRKVLTKEPNNESIWGKWTGEMVNKTVIRRALKRIREVLPELKETIYAFEHEEYQEPVREEPVIEIPVQLPTVDLECLTPEERADSEELFELWNANPKLAEDKFTEIKGMIEQKIPAQEIVNTEYASLACLKRSKKKWKEIGGYFSAKD